MSALAREGGVFVQLGFKRSDEHSGVVVVEFDRWVSGMGGWEDEKLDLIRKRRMMRKTKQMRMSLRLMENWVLDFMVLDGLELCFGKKTERERENI